MDTSEMADAGAGCHQVELPRTHHRVRALAVAVFDLAARKANWRFVIRCGGGAGHPSPAGSDVMGSVVVGEAPGADHRTLFRRAGSRRTQHALGDAAELRWACSTPVKRDAWQSTSSGSGSTLLTGSTLAPGSQWRRENVRGQCRRGASRQVVARSDGLQVVPRA